jgi:hypothetical protein
MPNPDIIFHVAEAEIGTIPNSPGSYHGAALAGVDRRIRLSNDGMMESGKAQCSQHAGLAGLAGLR